MASLARSLWCFPVTVSGNVARRALSSSSSFTVRTAIHPRFSLRAGVLVAPRPRIPALGSTSLRFSSELAADPALKARFVGFLENQVEVEIRRNVAAVEENMLRKLRNRGWQVKEKEKGNDEVTLTKYFDNEKISVTFSLSDVNRQDYSDEMDQKNENEVEDGENSRIITINAIVNCEKPENGVLTFDVAFFDGEAIIRNVSHYSSPDIARSADLKADWEKRGLYGGPLFSELDDDFKENFREYIEERGIDCLLARVVADYAEVCEQKEYETWLERVMKFVKAS